jgi:hypothetical protein
MQEDGRRTRDDGRIVVASLVLVSDANGRPSFIDQFKGGRPSSVMI